MESAESRGLVLSAVFWEVRLLSRRGGFWMRFVAVLVLGVVFSVLPGFAQEPGSGSALIESRQAEVRQLGMMLYGINLDRGSWVHQQAPICPAFSHHVFARYDRRTSAGVDYSFMAIYNVDIPPAKSLMRPWQGGIVLVPLVGPGPAVERAGTITTFNHVWSDELQRSGHPDSFPGITWGGLADCYLALANEQRGPRVETGPVDDPSGIDLKKLPVHSVLVPLQPIGPRSRSVSIEFDGHGLITSATAGESK